jgi:hypothetical protein
MGVFDCILCGLAALEGEPDTVVIDASHLKAHRTAANLLKRGSSSLYRALRKDGFLRYCDDFGELFNMTNYRKTAVTELVEEHMPRLPGNDGLSNEVSYFREQLEKDSLNQRVADALLFRKQGHFDKAMLGISEVNRDQVTAVRRIQSLLAKVDDEPYPVPVFEKFRQQKPFEIGLLDATPALQLLSVLGGRNNPKISEAVSSLHDCEGRIRDESDYIDFLHRKGSSDSKLQKAEKDKTDLLLEADEIRAAILKMIFPKIHARAKGLHPTRENALLLLELVQNVFQVMTSSIATRHAIDVDVFDQ